MDVSALRVADTAAIHVKNAAGEPLYDGDKPIRIIIYSPGSRAFAALETRQTARAVNRHNQNEGKLVAASAEDRAVETAEDLAAITVAFEGLTYGEKVGKELFEAVYSDPALGFITRQVTRFAQDWSNFRAASAGN